MSTDTDTIGHCARAALKTLERLTTDAFSRGGDRPARESLVRILAMVGMATDEERAEYDV